MIFDMPYPLIRYNDITRLNIWIYTKKVDTKQNFILHFSKHKGGIFSMTHRPYDEDFKKSIVALYQNGKTQSQLSKEYGASLSAIGKWIRLYSEVKTVDGDIMTAKNSGMPCISVLWGFRSRQFLIAHGAATFVEKPSEILDI